MGKAVVKPGSSDLAWVALVLGVTSLPVLAAESSPVRVAPELNDRWSVVGVISGNDDQGAPIGIAVLKNQETKRSYTVSIGAELPTEYGVRLTAVEDRKVIVSDSKRSWQLQFAESAVAPEDDEDGSSTARFLDNYYRSLNQTRYEAMLDEAAGTEGDQTDDLNGIPAGQDLVDGPETGESGGVISLKRYQPLRDRNGAEVDIYRPERVYRFETSEVGGEESAESAQEAGQAADAPVDAAGGSESGDPAALIPTRR